ncbi:GtrA family protein [Ramlibacter sp.]|uniref:GtrA family protein n=1 Tax=Ramlibacter sp. TaxID=1917967 RepID=UPI0035B37FA4
MIAAFRSRQFIAFLVTGGIAAAVNFGSRILLTPWLGFGTSVVVAYLIGMATAFLLARAFVFTESKQAVHQSALWFVAVNVLAVAQTWVISMALAYWALPALGVTRFVEEIAHAVGVVVPVFTSYLGHKHFSFR